MPKLKIVIGGNGAGKTTWTKANRHKLPKPFYNADSMAAGLGDWNDSRLQRRARQLVDREIEEHLQKREDFGFESTYSGASRPAIVERAKSIGYTIDVVFMGTPDPEINVQRVAVRAAAGTGHAVAPAEIRRRWHAAQKNLVRTFKSMDSVEVIDNSGETATRMLQLQKGRVVSERSPMPEWIKKLADALQVVRIGTAVRSGSAPGPAPL